ncbi:MAG: hypothetical protein KatS3mg065_0820 [Chloroflexota bacterium]|nr:MAG: hypothetical protein KatS3mg065_0820 [Chloroflexota bacterium]
MAGLRLGHDEAGHEGADDRRQADGAGNDGEAEHEDEGGHEGGLGEEGPGEDLPAEPPGSAGGGEAKDDETDGREGDEEGRRPEVPLDGPDDEADGDEGEDVVDDGRPEDDAREGTVQDPELGQDPGGDADARRGEGEADERRSARRFTDGDPDDEPADDREDHGDDGDGRRGSPDGEEIVEADLEADGEEEDDDADLGENRRRLAGRDEGERVRPHEEAAEELADDRRLSEASGDLLAELGTDEEDEQPGQDVDRLALGRRRRSERRRPGQADSREQIEWHWPSSSCIEWGSS